MANYDYDLEPKRPRNWMTVFWNILTFFVLCAVACVSCYFLAIFTNPYIALNPFPPPTLPPARALPSATPTLSVVLPATWTATNSPVPSLTDTPPPPPATTPPDTPVLILNPTKTATTTRPPDGYPYEIREGSPKAIPNLYHPELGCSWMGVGGQAIDLSGSPVVGMIIRLGGSLPGLNLSTPLLSLTGVALDYGRAGYEFQLGDGPIASRGSVWLQLLEQDGSPLSEKVYFDTYDSCEQNLIVIDFKQVR